MKPNPLPRLLHIHRWKIRYLTGAERDKLGLRRYDWYRSECRCGETKEPEQDLGWGDY